MKLILSIYDYIMVLSEFLSSNGVTALILLNFE